MSKKKKKLNVTLSPKHGPVTGALNAAGALWGMAALAEAGWVDLPPELAAGVAGTGLVLSQMSAHARKLGVGSRLHRLYCWACAGGWSWWALSHGVWDGTTLSVGAAAAFVAALGAPVVADLERSRGELRAHKVQDQQRWDLARQWSARLERVCMIRGAQCKSLHEWEHPDPATGKLRKTGYTIDFLLPTGGKGWETLLSHKKQLITDLDLPAGCSVDIEQGVTSRRVLIHVTTLNVLTDDIPLAVPEHLPDTIDNPRTIGLTTRGAAVKIPLRWTSAVLVGAKRQGKSNTLKSIARSALACDDVLVMGIDPNGGEVFLPFLRPWLEGKTQRPAIDWVATDEVEAARMLQFLRGMVPRRRSGYSNLMWSTGGDDKLQVSHEIPHILLLTDESKALDPKLKKLLVDLNDRCGAASISMVTSWLRAVSNANEGLPRDLLMQSETVLTVRMNEDTELKRAFGLGSKVPPAGEAIAPGWGHVRALAGEVPSLYKSARSTNEDAYNDAIAYDRFRPVLDRLSVGEDTEVYDRRWERAAAAGWLPLPLPSTTAAASVAPAAPVVGSAGSGEGKPQLSRQERSQRALEMRNRLRQASGKPPLDENGNEVVEPVGPAPASPEATRVPSAEDAALRARFDALVAGLDHDTGQGLEAGGGQQVPPFLEAVLSQFDTWGSDRVHRDLLAEALTQGDKEALNRLMGLLEIPVDPGPFRMPGHPHLGSRRGWKLEAVNKAVEQIRAGRPVPLEVMDWQPPTA